MKREQYKVLVNSKAETRMYRKALLAIGEKVDAEYYIFYDKKMYLVTSEDNDFVLFNHNHSCLIDKQEITFKELIKLLVNEQNNPTEIEVKLPPNHYCKVDRRDVMFYKNSETTPFFGVSVKELEQIGKALTKQLNNEN